MSREVLAELMTVLEQAAQQKGKHARAGLNWPQAVFRVTFHETAPEQELVAETFREDEE